MKVRAEGWLKHHFCGDYCATIVLAFPDAASAKDALPKLPGFKPGEKSPNALVACLSGDAFESAKTAIEALRVDSDRREPIDSCSQSIDYGPRFTIEVPVTPAEQRSLF
jgi:hypothetical protein